MAKKPAAPKYTEKPAAGIPIVSVEDAYDRAMAEQTQPYQKIVMPLATQNYREAQEIWNALTEQQREKARAHVRAFTTEHIPLLARANAYVSGFEA